MLGAIFFILTIFFFFSQYRYISILLLFAFLTGGFQLIPLKLMVMPPVGVTKSYDWVLLFMAVILLLKPKIFLEAAVWKNFKIIALYGITLIILLFYSKFVQNVETSVSIRVFRSLLYFTTIFLFVQLTQEEITKVLKILIVVTSLVAFIYCLQLLAHKTLLNNVSSDSIGASAMIERYYNLPVYIYPVIFFLFFNKNIFGVRFKNYFLLICCAAVLLSQHRNLLLAIVLCYFFHFLLNNKLSISKIAMYSIVSVGLIYIADTIWNNRFSKGLEDISQTTLAVSPSAFYEINLSELTTTQFRQYLLQERLNYILKSKEETLLGIGLVTDDSRKVASLNFNIGMSDGYGNVTQVASSDITWSSMLLQMGLVGTFIFIIFHLTLFGRFLRAREDAYMQVGALYILALFITSFFSNMIVLPYATALVMLFAAYYYHLTNPGFNNNSYND